MEHSHLGAAITDDGNFHPTENAGRRVIITVQVTEGSLQFSLTVTGHRWYLAPEPHYHRHQTVNESVELPVTEPLCHGMTFDILI